MVIASGLSGLGGVFGQPPTKAEALDWLKDYETKYHGMEIVFRGGGGSFSDQLVRLSRNGEAMSVEITISNDSSDVTTNSEYACPAFSIELNSNILNGNPNGSLNVGVIGSNGHVQRGSGGFFLLGYEINNGLRFSEVVGANNATISSSTTNRFDVDGFELVATRPNFPKFKFFFAAKPRGRLLGIDIDVKKGDKILVPWERNYTVGEDEPDGLESSTFELGPISYDSMGRQISTPWTWNGIIKGKDVAQNMGEEIYSYKPLEKDLPSDRAEFVNRKLPPRVPVKVFDSPVPHELRDGRLVAVIDSKAIEVGEKVGFRPPEGVRRFNWVLYFGLFLALAISIYLVVRKRSVNSQSAMTQLKHRR